MALPDIASLDLHLAILARSRGRALGLLLLLLLLLLELLLLGAGVGNVVLLVGINPATGVAEVRVHADTLLGDDLQAGRAK